MCIVCVLSCVCVHLFGGPSTRFHFSDVSCFLKLKIEKIVACTKTTLSRRDVTTMHPSPKRDGTLPSPLSSHMIKHHLRFRDISTINEGGEKDRESRLQGALEYEMGDIVRGIVEAARHDDLTALMKMLPSLRHVTQDHYLELLNEPLNAAVHSNHPRCVKELITYGADPNRLFNGEPSSVVAASEGNLESLLVIMESGCDLNRQSDLGFTPLMKACEHGNNEIVLTLIDAGADRDIKSKAAGLTALMIAAQRGNVHLCRALLTPNTATGATGCKKDTQEMALGYNALIFAARRDFVTVVEMFANSGMNLHSKDKQGMTAMHHAAYFNRIKTFRYLWTFAGCINDKDGEGRTPLMVAVQRGHRAIVDLCIGTLDTYHRNAKAEQRQREKEKETERKGYSYKEEKEEDEHEHEENEEEYKRSQRALADAIDIESQDIHGRTALIYAVLHSCHLLVPLLMVDGGASLNHQDEDQKTAYTYAEEFKLPKMCILLKNCVASRERRVLENEARRKRLEKETAKAARRAELSDSEFDFTSSEDDDDD